MDRRELIKAAGMASMAGIASAALARPTPTSTSAAPQPASVVSIQRLSWAGVKLRMGAISLLIDPWITPSSLGGAWKSPIVPVTVDTDRRYVLLTHLHNDHFDPAAIKEIARDSGFAVLVLESKAAAVASRGFRTYPVQMFEPFILGDITLIAVPAVDGFGETQVSWIVLHQGKRMIHCGDTLWHGGFWQLGRAYGPFDVAFLPINGAKVHALEPFSDVAATMTPQQAVAAALILGAKQLVPIHYGFNDPENYLEHPNAVAELEVDARKRNQSYRLLQPGESMEI